MSVYDYNVKTGERTLLKQQPVLGGYDPDQLRVGADLGDRQRRHEMPISLVYRKELRPERPAPDAARGIRLVRLPE